MPNLYFKRNIRLWDLNQRGTLVDDAVCKVFDHLGLTPDRILAQEARLQGKAPPQFVDAGRAIGG